MNSTHMRRVHICGSDAGTLAIYKTVKVLHAYLGTHENCIYGISLVILSVGRHIVCIYEFE